MKFFSFKKFLNVCEDVFVQINEAEDVSSTNTVMRHSTHIEDFVFLNNGVKLALSTLDSVRQEMSIGKLTSKKVISTKTDGSPAIICLWLNNTFYIGIKGALGSKNTNVINMDKMNSTNDDIERNYKGKDDLIKKLKIALQYLREVIPNKDGNCYQCDFLFADDGSLETTEIDGVPCYSWHPNTIVYSVEQNSDLGKQIGKAKIGVVFHTKYKVEQIDGTDDYTIQVDTFDINLNEFNKSSNVWFTDPFSNKDLGQVIFTEEEAKLYDTLKARCIKNNRALGNVGWTRLDTEYFKSGVMATFINSIIKGNSKQKLNLKPNDMKDMFIEFLVKRTNSANAKLNKEIASAKKEDTKIKKRETISKQSRQMNFTIEQIEEDSKLFYLFFDIYKSLYTMKMLFVTAFDRCGSKLKKHLKYENGSLVSTGDEGYVINITSARGCKLVDRFEFSKANFSADVVKGWMSEKRKQD